MDFQKVFDLIGTNNIDFAKVMEIVEEVKRIDINNDNDLKAIIRKVAKLSNKEISPKTENEIIKKIRTEGITSDLFHLM